MGCRYLGLLVLVTGCSQSTPPLLYRSVPQATLLSNRPPRADIPDPRHTVVKQARELLGGAPLNVGEFSFPKDPVGFVRAAYWAAQIEVVQRDESGNGLEGVFRSAAALGNLHHGHPSLGEMVFFDADDKQDSQWPVQVALVERVAKDGTINIIGLFSDGPRRIAMNLRKPQNEFDSAGNIINHRLQGSHTATAAELFRAFSDPY